MFFPRQVVERPQPPAPARRDPQLLRVVLDRGGGVRVEVPADADAVGAFEGVVGGFVEVVVEVSSMCSWS